MKILQFIKYVIHSASYGIIIAVVLLLLIPNLREGNFDSLNIFQPPQQSQAPLSYAKAVNIAGPAVVNIYSEEIQPNLGFGRTNRKSTRLGSGVIMDAGGYILTNYHVVQNADLIRIILQSGKRLSAELIGYDIYTDLAVLKVAATNLPVIPQKEGLASLVGDIVLAIGNPFNLGQTVTQGIISGTGRSGLSITSYQEFLQMDAAINEGNSGGALVNTNGELVGINSRKFSNASLNGSNNPNLNVQGIFFAVPYRLAYKIMQNIIENGRVIRGWLGVDAHSGRDGLKGFVIDGIAKNSPAYLANLAIGDLVYQINDVTIESLPQALDIIAETIPNTTLVFKVTRNKQALTVPVKIIELPARQ